MPRSHAFNPTDHIEVHCLGGQIVPADDTDLITPIAKKDAQWAHLIVVRATDADNVTTWTMQSSDTVGGAQTNILDRDGNPYVLSFITSDDDVLKHLQVPLGPSDQFINVHQVLSAGGGSRYEVVLELYHPKRSDNIIRALVLPDIGFA